MINTPAIFRRLSNGFTLPSRGMLAAWDMTVHNNVNILPVGADTYATSGGWAAFDSSTITITPGQLDPNGTTNAYRVQCSAGGGTSTSKYLNRFNVLAGTSLCASIWVKGTGNILIGTTDGGGNSYAVTSSWQKISLSYTASGSSLNSGFYFRALANGSAADLYVYQPSITYGATATDYTPPQGYAIQTFHNEAENNLTNIVDYSESPTNAVWEIGSYGITKTATTGKSLIAGDAIRLQFTGGTTPNPNSYLLQTLVTTGTSIGDQYCFGAWIYSATDETLWVGANAIQISTSYSITELAGDYGILNVTSGWHFYKWRTIAQTTANALAVQFNITSPFMSTDSFDITIWHPQASRGKDLKPYIHSTDGLYGDLALMRGTTSGSDTNDFSLTGIGMVYGSDDVGKVSFPAPVTQHRTIIAVANFTDVTTEQYLLDHLGCELIIDGGYLMSPTGTSQATSPISTGWHVIFAVRKDDSLKVWVDGTIGINCTGSFTALGTAATIGNNAAYTKPLLNRLMFMCVYDRALEDYEFNRIIESIEGEIVVDRTFIPINPAPNIFTIDHQPTSIAWDSLTIPLVSPDGFSVDHQPTGISWITSTPTYDHNNILNIEHSPTSISWFETTRPSFGQLGFSVNHQPTDISWITATPEYTQNNAFSMNHQPTGIAWFETTRPSFGSENFTVNHQPTGISWITTYPSYNHNNTYTVNHQITGIAWFTTAFSIIETRWAVPGFYIGQSDIQTGFDANKKSTHDVSASSTTTGNATLVKNNAGFSWSPWTSHIQSWIPDFIGQPTRNMGGAAPADTTSQGLQISPIVTWWTRFTNFLELGPVSGATNLEFRLALNTLSTLSSISTGAVGTAGTQQLFYGKCIGVKVNSDIGYFIGYGTHAADTATTEAFCTSFYISENGAYPHTRKVPVTPSSAASGSEVLLCFTKTGTAAAMSVINSSGTKVFTSGCAIPGGLSSTATLFVADVESLCQAGTMDYTTAIGVSGGTRSGNMGLYPYAGWTTLRSPTYAAGGTSGLTNQWGSGSWQWGPVDINAIRDENMLFNGITITGTTVEGVYPLEWASAATSGATPSYNAVGTATNTNRYWWFREKVSHEANAYTTTNRWSGYNPVNVPKQGLPFGFSIYVDGWGTIQTTKFPVYTPSEKSLGFSDKLTCITWTA